MTEAPELLPCPFCGGIPYLVNVEMAGCSYVACNGCRVQTEDGSQEQVIAKWNTRDSQIDAAYERGRIAGLRELYDTWVIRDLVPDDFILDAQEAKE